MTARVVEVIISDDATIGKGKEGDPVRRLIKCYDLQGNLLFEKDVLKDKEQKIPDKIIEVKK